MTYFVATYESASGQTRTITIKAADLTTAKKLCEDAKIDTESRVQDLTEDQVVGLRNAISNLSSKVEGELRSEVAMNIKRLKDAGAYRGIRHRRGLPSNGQRTKTNARTRKGPKRPIRR